MSYAAPFSLLSFHPPDRADSAEERLTWPLAGSLVIHAAVLIAFVSLRFASSLEQSSGSYEVTLVTLQEISASSTASPENTSRPERNVDKVPPPKAPEAKPTPKQNADKPRRPHRTAKKSGQFSQSRAPGEAEGAGTGDGFAPGCAGFRGCAKAASPGIAPKNCARAGSGPSSYQAVACLGDGRSANPSAPATSEIRLRRRPQETSPKCRPSGPNTEAGCRHHRCPQETKAGFQPRESDDSFRR